MIFIQTYTVKKGDTLYGISNQFGVSVTELAELNNIKGSFLQIGSIINIPSNAGSNPDNMFMYTVKSGDSLYSIARRYNTTVDEIMKLNYLSTVNLKVGQVIRIPEMFTPDSEMILPEYINYTVKKGDSLYSIAKQYNITVNDLIKDNNLNNSNLYIGQIIKIKDSNSSYLYEECFGEDYDIPIANTMVNYTVKKGDSLYSIAKKYNTSTSKIISLNNLKNSLLSIGQVLKIPDDSNSDIVYIVKKGDSLYSISKEYNISVDDIKKKNNLKSNVLSVGQQLYIGG